MGILSDFFIADRTEKTEYDGGPDFHAEERCQFKSITPLEAAGILSVLRGGGDRLDMLDAFPLLTPEEAEQWTIGIPAEMTTALAAIDDLQIPSLAQKCADVTGEELGWSSKDFEDVLNRLRALARRAVASDKSMYLWNSL
jgi:hypothetical protein